MGSWAQCLPRLLGTACVEPVPRRSQHFLGIFPQGTLRDEWLFPQALLFPGRWPLSPDGCPVAGQRQHVQKVSVEGRGAWEPASLQVWKQECPLCPCSQGGGDLGRRAGEGQAWGQDKEWGRGGEQAAQATRK